ncbi:hypothetical protein DMJ13_11135 [halophilic archaeon]|nr:hypothetical protein DMJ13_11135 [halophilic archaeon]
MVSVRAVAPTLVPSSRAVGRLAFIVLWVSMAFPPIQAMLSITYKDPEMNHRLHHEIPPIRVKEAVYGVSTTMY